ncbi:MAG: hypothetical protein MZV64_34030 [Ignavibacteriales bacterium]|nr:hypothetical protein [Ignavibacteriales bacterium]
MAGAELHGRARLREGLRRIRRPGRDPGPLRRAGPVPSGGRPDRARFDLCP